MKRIFNRLYRKFRKWTESNLGIPVRALVPVERIGTPYGGWIIPKDFLQADAVCYLVGAGEDISFDLGVSLQYGCPVHIFDPTPRAIDHVHQLLEAIREGRPMACATSPDGYYPEYPASLASRIFLHPYGVWESDGTLQFFAPENKEHVSHSLVDLQHSGQSIEVPVRRLHSLMQELGHSHIDLLKLDVEGAEYQILDSILTDRIAINVLCIEYDETANNHLDRYYLTRIKNSLLRLQEAGFEVIAKEPDCRNYTLIHRRCLAKESA